MGINRNILSSIEDDLGNYSCNKTEIERILMSWFSVKWNFQD